MLRKFESLLPGFIKDLDKRMLLNHPSLWASKIHYVLFFGLIGLGLAFIAGRFSPVSLKSVPDVSTRWGLALIPAAIALIFWAWRISLFDVRKQFGTFSRKLHLRDQLIYLFVFALAFSIPLSYGWQLEKQVANEIDDHTLSNDINTLNLGANYFSPLNADNVYTQYNWEEKMQNLDYNPFLYYNWEEDALWDDWKVMNMFLDNKDEAVHLQRIEAFLQTLAKYHDHSVNLDPVEVLEHFKDRNYDRQVRLLSTSGYNYAEEMARDNIYALQYAKAGKSELHNRKMYLTALMFLFAGFLFLLNFLQSDWRYMLGAVAIASLLGIMGSMVVVGLDMVSPFTSDMIVYSVFLLIWCLSFMQIFMGRNTRKRLVWKRLNLIMASVAMPIIPAMLYNWWGNLQEQYFFTNDDQIEAFIFIGLAFGLVVWNLFLYPQQIKLSARPTEN